MARSTSPIGGGGYGVSGSSTSTQQSTWLRWRKALPSVRGIAAFTWAITSGARRAAGGELADEIEIAHRHEFDPPPAPRLVEAGRHVPRRKAERRVLGPREGIVAEVNAAQQRQIG